MQRQEPGDSYERYPSDRSYAPYGTPSHYRSGGSRTSPDRSQAYHDSASPQRVNDSSSSTSSHSRAHNNHGPQAPATSRHTDRGPFPQGGVANGAANPIPGGMAGLAYNVADHGSSGYDPAHAPGSIPPPPSRALRPDGARQPMSPYTGNTSYDPYYARGQDSNASLNPFGTPPATHSPSRSLNSFGRPNSQTEDLYQSYSGRSRHDGANLGYVDPQDIEDDGDDGLNYSRHPPRSSIFNRGGSDRNGRPGAKGVAGGAGAAASTQGLISKSGDTTVRAVDGGAGPEKPSAWLEQQKGHSKTCKWVTIIVVFLLIAGAIVGGVLGALVGNKKGSSGPSASDDAKENGDLDINSKEIKALMNNPDLHKVFPGMDYTPYKTQYPDCMSDPPSQNNITRDVAVLSQLTNKLRLYGTDCNQTEMVIHAVRQLKMEKDIKIWLGVWQDKNETTNSRQLEQTWKILDQYGADPFEGVIVANEIIFRKEMSISSLGDVISDVRKKLASKNINLPVATSDLGDDWTSDLAKESDYIMANIHPFFAGVSADIAASWTYSFWEGKDGQFWKTDKNKNIVAETGWPSEGGKNCGQSQTTTCSPGAVAGIKEMNRFMDDWVCQALNNGTQYFWFEAFDEPWKVRFNEKGKEWEDKWGLMGLDRKLKDGVKIPSCGGKTV